jgi:kanamycin nucleotidyltransferase
MPGGPKPMDNQQRAALVEQIAEKLRQHYKGRLQALGVYGSLARGTDGPYSDIDMYCIVDGQEIETCHEWSSGDWKADVDVYSADVALRWAAVLDVDWPITHAACLAVKPLEDPQGIFPRMREAALSHSEQAYKLVMEDVIVGEIYELVGKLRNAYSLNNSGYMPIFTIELVRFAACLVGLANHHLYSSSSRFLEESLTLPDRPLGYDALCHLGMAGILGSPDVTIKTVDAFWAGVEEWAAQHDLHIERELDELLSQAGEAD